MEQEITRIVSGYISKIFEAIVVKYPMISLNDLNEIYNQASDGALRTTKKAPVKKASPSLKSCSKDDLVKLCKTKNLKTTGTKDELIKRLSGDEYPIVVQKLQQYCSPIRVKKNTYGHREHAPTKLVFNDDRMVFGVQKDDGSVGELTPELIDECNKYKFRYKLPLNLDTNVKSDEIDKHIKKLIEEDV